MPEGSEHIRRILVVEDNLSDVILLRHALQENGVCCELEALNDGRKAIERVESFADARVRPDLFVLDLNLPCEDGLEVLARIRSVPVLWNVPVVILTNSDSPRERQRAEALGVRRYLNKPLDLQDLVLFGASLKEILDERTCVSGN